MIKSHHPDETSIVLTVEASRIDAACAMSFKEEARQMLQDQSGRVILDMGQVEFLDSSGLGTLVAIMKLLGKSRKLELVNCRGAVLKVLQLTRMDAIFVVHPPAGMNADSPVGRDAA